MLPKIILFDVDETLTQSKQPLEPAMATLLGKLLDRTNVGIISGGKYSIMREQVADRLPPTANRENLFLLPTSGSVLFYFQSGIWENVYDERLTQEEIERITQTIEEVLLETGIIDLSEPPYGIRIENRESQVTLSALGQEAPLAKKIAWDPTGEKRDRLRAALLPRLSEFDVKRGGTTSIDVTKHGINKAFGARRVSEYLKIPISDMLYVGDALFPGGNDEVVKETGIETQQVKNPEDTAKFIKELLTHE